MEQVKGLNKTHSLFFFFLFLLDFHENPEGDFLAI